MTTNEWFYTIYSLYAMMCNSYRIKYSKVRIKLRNDYITFKTPKLSVSLPKDNKDVIKSLIFIIEEFHNSDVSQMEKIQIESFYLNYYNIKYKEQI